MPHSASVVLRTRNSARTIEGVLDDLEGQTVPPEIIVVDSGSTDATLELVKGRCATVRTLEPADYRPGHALNIGCAAARAGVCFAVSSHCRIPRADWIERALAHYEDSRVAGTNGAEVTPHGAPLRGPYLQDHRAAVEVPAWGFSNHASSWRVAAWREHPFSATLPTTEDKEWALRVLGAGWLLAFDPALLVDMSHRWRHGSARYLQRERLERRWMHSYADPPPYGLRELARDWWWPQQPGGSLLRARLNYRRAAGLLGRHLGDRAGRRAKAASGAG